MLISSTPELRARATPAWIAAVGVVAALAAACVPGESLLTDTLPTSTGSGSSGQTSGTDSASSTGADTDALEVTSSSTGDSDSGSGGEGEPAGEGEPCSLALPCAAGLFCDYADDRCGQGEELGLCAPPPIECDDLSDTRYCGCDGAVHLTPCDVMDAGLDVSALGQCEPPEGAFACAGSPEICGEGQACMHAVSDGGVLTIACTTAGLDGCGLDCGCILEVFPECIACTIEGDFGVVLEC
ncbi:MAG: hypothetical protein KC486_22405 [Myxococcales bacterium]|nr:hypothetical protein [Myxococcales bacterium]